MVRLNGVVLPTLVSLAFHTLFAWTHLVPQHSTRLSSTLESRRDHDFVIDLDPETCGCNAGELAVLGSCQPISFGDDLSACQDNCKPGQWCREGRCVAIQIVLDPIHCGSLSPETCKSGSACINGVCQHLKLGDDSSSCDAGKKNSSCHSGHYCWKGECRPITVGYANALIIGTDSLQCGAARQRCDPGFICSNGQCQRLHIGDDCRECGDEARPGNLCYEKEVVPMHIATDKARCGDEEMSVSGVCWGGVPKEHHVSPTQQDHSEQTSGQRQQDLGSHQQTHQGQSSEHHPGQYAAEHTSNSQHGQHSGHRGGQKFVNYHDLSYHEEVLAFEHSGRVWEFGEASNCRGRPCSFNSICCFGQCLSITSPWGIHHGADSPFSGCPSCPSGHFCFERTCRPVSIDEGGFGGQCGISTCSPNGICVSGVVCVDLTPANAGNCGLFGPCPSGSLCILGTCVSTVPGLPSPGPSGSPQASTGLPGSPQSSPRLPGSPSLRSGLPALSSSSPGLPGSPQPSPEVPIPQLCGVSLCAANEVCFAETCQNLATDPTSCGVPDNICAPLNPLCVSGICTDNPDLLCGGFRCENPEICIENQCRNIVTNPSACGPGQTVCAMNQICQNGLCVIPTFPGRSTLPNIPGASPTASTMPSDPNPTAPSTSPTAPSPDATGPADPADPSVEPTAPPSAAPTGSPTNPSAPSDAPSTDPTSPSEPDLTQSGGSGLDPPPPASPTTQPQESPSAPSALPTASDPTDPLPPSDCGVGGCDAGFLCIGSVCLRVVGQDQCNSVISLPRRSISVRQLVGCPSSEVCSTSPTEQTGCVGVAEVVNGVPAVCSTPCDPNALCTTTGCQPILREASCASESTSAPDFRCPADSVCAGDLSTARCVSVIAASSGSSPGPGDPDPPSTSCDSTTCQGVCYQDECLEARDPDTCIAHIEFTVFSRRQASGCPAGFTCTTVDSTSRNSCLPNNVNSAFTSQISTVDLCVGQDGLTCPTYFVCAGVPNNGPLAGNSFACFPPGTITPPESTQCDSSNCFDGICYEETCLSSREPDTCLYNFFPPTRQLSKRQATSCPSGFGCVAIEGADNSCVPISAENTHTAIVEDIRNCPSEGVSCSQGFSCARVPSLGGVDSFACFPTASLRAPTQCDSTNCPSGICYNNICRELESSQSICITNEEIPLPLLRRQATACPIGFGCVDIDSQKACIPSTVGNTYSPPQFNDGVPCPTGICRPDFSCERVSHEGPQNIASFACFPPGSIAAPPQ